MPTTNRQFPIKPIKVMYKYVSMNCNVNTQPKHFAVAIVVVVRKIENVKLLEILVKNLTYARKYKLIA